MVGSRSRGVTRSQDQLLYPMTSPEFAALVADFIARDPDRNPRALAVEFEVAESTALRWASELARPHPTMQHLISVWIQAKLGGR